MLSDSERRTVRELESALLADRSFTRAVLPVARQLDKLAAPVVVGVSADPRSSSALHWAAAEAAAQQRPLRIVHAVASPLFLDPLGVVPTVEGMGAQQAAATELVDAALARVRAIAPGIEVSACIVRDSPRRVLVRESRGAHLLVLGSRRKVAHRTGVRRLLPGSLALRLTTSAQCPVAVVHPAAATQALVAPRVVVGIDGHTCSDAVGFAFRVAAQRGMAVTAVYAWTADSPAGLETVPASRVPTESAAYAVVESAVAEWRELYPEVPLTTEVVHLDPATALIAGSVGAALVVVGSRGRRGGFGTLSASVSRAVVDGAAGPVAVVRPGSESPPGGDRWARR